MKAKIYTKTTCPYCTRAKELLASKNISYEEIVLDGVKNNKDTMMKELGVQGLNTVPQISIDGQFIPGGYTGLRLHFR